MSGGWNLENVLRVPWLAWKICVRHPRRFYVQFHPPPGFSVHVGCTYSQNHQIKQKENLQSLLRYVRLANKVLADDAPSPTSSATVAKWS